MESFHNKTLLITGGTGSFGKAVLNKYLNSGFKEIRIFSRDELKQEELRIKIKNPKVKFFIGDVRNYASVKQALVGVDYVFQVAPKKKISKLELLIQIKEVFGLKTQITTKESKYSDKSLIASSGCSAPHYSVMLSELKDFLLQNKDIYKNYLG